MAKHESTAVNEMIERLATMKPLPADPSDDLMFSPARPSLAQTMEWRPQAQARSAAAPPPRRNRSANGTPVGTATMKGAGTLPQAQPVAVPPPSPAMTMQGLGPAVQRAIGAGTPPPPPPRRRVTPAPHTIPVAAPFESGAMEAAAAAAALEASPSRTWIEEEPPQAGRERGREAWSGTLVLSRRRKKSFAGRLIAPMIGLAAAGAFVAGYVAYESQGVPRAPSASPPPAAVAAQSVKAAPAPVPAVAPAPIPAPPAFVDVMILSSPAGATVTLVDRGKTSFIGTTPISTAIDPSRRYELVFSHPSVPTRVEPLDPSATRRVEVSLGEPAKTERAVAEPAALRAEQAVADAASPAEKVAEQATAPAAPRARKAAAGSAGTRAEKAGAGPTGEGVLMISSKPPCEILIDGKPTGLTTPQRAMLLPPGGHKVTLVNKAEDINKTLSVQISADQPTKVIENLMK